MCGIVGYVGRQRAVPILMEGLQRLEYRGYDSAGLATFENSQLVCEKMAGRVKVLRRKLKGRKFSNTIGIAHTRWATHGPPNEKNAHPHLDCDSKIAVVHNGIIDNCDNLKGVLIKKGHHFVSQTDTEVLAHLIEEYLDGDPLQAVRSALADVEGTYGIAVIFTEYPDCIVFARQGSPLHIGLGKGQREKREYFVASDASSFRKYTDKQIILEDGQIGMVQVGKCDIRNMKNVRVSPRIKTIEWQIAQMAKGGYRYFMQKEIYGQPKSLRDALRGRMAPNGTVKLGGLMGKEIEPMLKSAPMHVITAAGTSLYASMDGEILFQEIAKVPAEAKNASELANQKFPCFPKGTVGWAVSQSGETKDLLDAMETLKRVGVDVMAICNVVGSSITHKALSGVYLHAGPETGVASTKAYTAQLMVLHLISLRLRQIRGIRKEPWMKKYIQDLRAIPERVEDILKLAPEIQKLADKYSRYRNFLYLGRGINYPTALEGALKLKEISYIHAEGYPMAEMKHGPLALIDKRFPTVCIVPKNDDCYSHIISNIKEIKARGGPVIAIANKGDKEINKHVDDVIYIPATTYYLTPILFVVPLQLFAYYVAVKRRRNVDRPRNLAKSVTV